MAAARAHGDFDASNPMTWLLLAGFAGTLASAAVLSVRMERHRPSPVLAGT